MPFRGVAPRPFEIDAGVVDDSIHPTEGVDLFGEPARLGRAAQITGDDRRRRGEIGYGGWSWRYDLVPLGPSTTAVTLTYDWSAVPQSVRDYLHFPPFGPDHLANSLRRLAELARETAA